MERGYVPWKAGVSGGERVCAMESRCVWRREGMCHGEPMCLEVSPEDPVHTDPKATVLWSGDLDPVLQSTFSLNYFLGGRTGEEFQLRFSNAPGFVVVQPFEEHKFGPRHRYRS
eukprot:TRINITY_DN6295_c0_g1_i1.p2 TRINITY_DN6295_c0_g1~~TRINITY_DN6295_c0_g1_i1.p2  ORF type:complete len:114 (+),score=15.69 TRINITY_DN6295_c0_g1_i1:57-398(+)